MPAVFLFGGQGSQYYGMGRDLLNTSPPFASALRALDEVFADAGLPGTLTEIYRADRTAADPFRNLRHTHPAILMVQLALLDALGQEGIAPDAVLGASLGEYAAAVASGVVGVEDVATCVARQVAMVDQLCPRGAMLAVFDEADRYEGSGPPPGCEIAAINTDRHVVLAGPSERIEAVTADLRRREVLHQRLDVAYAFHSRLMDPVREPYLRSLESLAPRPPKLPILSCESADLVTDFSPEHLWRMVRAPIRFRDAVRRIEREFGDALLVDLAPSGTLATFVTQIVGRRSAVQAIAVLNPFAPAGAGLASLRARHLGERRQETRQPVPRGESMRAFVFPGQGSQVRGMGGGLFEAFPSLTAEADDLLGYSVADVCLRDPQDRLTDTRFTQPALFVVNALTYLAHVREQNTPVDFLAGHSLGEYNALFAAGVIDFATALRLVRRRGELMAKITGGAMAAVLGLEPERIRCALTEADLGEIDLANLNAPDQTVISGPSEAVRRASDVLREAGARGVIPLRVGGAFHSRYMTPAARRFEESLAAVDFCPFKTPVIANSTGRPYADGEVARGLADQLVSPVRWEESIRYLLAAGVDEIVELGPGRVLTALTERIRRTARASAPPSPRRVTITSTSLGSAAFRRAYGVKYSYVCGAMYRGISSEDLVVAAARAGVLAFFGAGGLPPERVERAVVGMRRSLGDGLPFGVNLVHDPLRPQTENDTVEVLLRQRVPVIEASAFMKVTPALVRYRLSGVVETPQGGLVVPNRIIAKLSRPEVAESFLAAPPDRIVRPLVQQGWLTDAEARLAERVPMADDLCVEGDSAGHTDRRDWMVLLPVIRHLRDRCGGPVAARDVRIGVAGGIGTPAAAAAAFLLGADFVVTGSINLCTVEADMSPLVKGMLETMAVQDTDYAPAGDMFEQGSQVQVLKRGVFFPARARKLLEIYRRFDSLDDIDPATRDQIESRYFKRSLEEVWQETRDYFEQRDPAQVAKAEGDPKHRMALVLRWYFGHSQRSAMSGEEAHRLDFQVHCGPALGAFNDWVAGTSLRRWSDRRVGDIAERIMHGAAEYLRGRFDELSSEGVA